MARTALPRYGVGAAARPSSSATTAASRAEAPAPPASSGTSREAAPRSRARVRHSFRSYGSEVSQRARTLSCGQRSASSARTLERSSSSISE